MVCIAPLVEELGFRGFIQQRLESLLPVPAALIATTVFFGLFHLGSGILLAILAAALGAIAGVLVRKSDSVLPGLAVHASWNATLMGMDGLRRFSSVQGGAVLENGVVNAMLLVLGALLVTASLFGADAQPAAGRGL